MRVPMCLAGLIASMCFVVSAQGVVSTGLDQIGSIIAKEERLAKKVDPAVIEEAANAAEQMNTLIVQAIVGEGVANDGIITASDAMQINLFLVDRHQETYASLREKFFAIERKGSRELLLNTNAINSVFSNVYNIGLEVHDKCRMSRPDGKKGTSFKTVSYYLSELLADDLANQTLVNPDFQEITGTTGTSLDQMIDLIFIDRGLNKRIPLQDMREAALAADEMNSLILDAIFQEGLANDGNLSVADVRQINLYLVQNHRELWAELHGDDEDGEDEEESGYHYIQNDGATTRMFAANLFNSVLDGIYHLGFKTDKKNRLVNEDGNANKNFEQVAWWLGTILEDELVTGQLANNEYREVAGTTETSFDLIIPIIYEDEGLQYRVSTSDIRTGAEMANRMNKLIVEAIRETEAALDDHISADEVGQINRYLVARYAEEWKELHGDDEEDVETGFHRIQNDGAVSEAFGKNLINNVADSVYHLGFETPYDNRLVNEDGKKNASFKTIAYWFNRSLEEDYALGLLD